MQDLYSQSLADLEQYCTRLAVSTVHAKTLYRRLFKDFDTTPWTTPGLPHGLAEQMPHDMRCTTASIAEESQSRYDGTVKFLVRMEDGSLVESVLMPEKKRITLCLSSQVGCAMACTFCHTGRMGLKRNLTAGEIAAQVVLAQRWIRDHAAWREERGYPGFAAISNIVFMGMGEPLDNIDEVSQALRILSDPMGLNLSLRKISVSTAGHLDGLKILLERFPKVSLALSLHATTERERSQLMPINRRWPIGTILDYLRNFYQQRDDDACLLVQYTVIRGVNDTLDHADRMVELLRGVPVKLNLIPLNEVEPSRFQSPEPESLQRFRDHLNAAGVRVMIRYSKGQDIAAACGQLVVSAEKRRLSPSAEAVTIS
ncbi:MAG TPA: 23S rRNA (adenine(2503)-C(2))-methyltransferase RlmN [Oligoflexus sp.]|uniref:23S rRNA (adenine(2503)-C(2))-methyltransferase RlmN n=1 Tax=Oligoflexus sp. TaxID=1971216 RepID=UPI002D72B5B9|nr:23S rRNA (adenine(2503)-C(2))-methyltransferase RlmN [Oligoflexus sp.]HYX31841.1 23S rRNA (adenine(2503)-C(2))-methyltransferase RlmN [Oligoflexus sp.]